MARLLRIEYAGALYHVTCRGNARGKIFLVDPDRELFLQVLAQAVERFNWLCHAYCQMTNHCDLLALRPPKLRHNRTYALERPACPAGSDLAPAPGSLFRGFMYTSTCAPDGGGLVSVWLDVGYLVLFGVGLSLMHFLIGLLVWALFRSGRTSLKMVKDGFKPFIRDGSLFFYTAATTATSYGQFHRASLASNQAISAPIEFIAFIVFLCLLGYSVIFYTIIVAFTLSARVKCLAAKLVLIWSLPAVVLAAAYSVLLGLVPGGAPG